MRQKLALCSREILLLALPVCIQHEKHLPFRMPVVDDSKASAFAATLFSPPELSHATSIFDQDPLLWAAKQRFLKKPILVIGQHFHDLTREYGGFNEPHERSCYAIGVVRATFDRRRFVPARSRLPSSHLSPTRRIQRVRLPRGLSGRRRPGPAYRQRVLLAKKQDEPLDPPDIRLLGAAAAVAGADRGADGGPAASRQPLPPLVECSGTPREKV